MLYDPLRLIFSINKGGHTAIFFQFVQKTLIFFSPAAGFHFKLKFVCSLYFLKRLLHSLTQNKKITVLNCRIIKKTLLKYIKKTISIKAPNDLLINKKKICGILQEIKFNNEAKFIVIGVGINLIKNPKIKNYPTTNILSETGFKVKKNDLIKNIEKNYISNLKLFA